MKSESTKVNLCMNDTFRWFNDRNDSETTENFIIRMKKTYGEDVVALVALEYPQVYGGAIE
jgi:hypothetical protein